MADVRLIEIPIAQVAQFIRLGQIDTKKSKIPQIADLCIFSKKKKEEDEFPPAAAGILFGLFHEGKCPDLAISILPEIKEAAKRATEIPQKRAFRSDCKNLWIINPEIKGEQIHGLIIVNNGLCGNIQVRDIDKKYHTINVFLPPSESFAYIEERMLQIKASVAVKNVQNLA